MQKTINVIVYKPGFAGNFLTLVLSLDKRTFPWVPVGEVLENDSQRKEFYSFTSLQDSNQAWQSHDFRFDTRINDFINSTEYDTMIWRVHPNIYYEIYRDMLMNIAAPKAKINFLTVHASPEVEYEHVDKFKERNNFTLYRQETVLFEKFEKEHKSFNIKLDNLFSTEEAFLTEYDRINKYLGLPDHHEDALWLYRDWRKARETERSESANDTSNTLMLNKLFDLVKFRAALRNTEWLQKNQEWLKSVWCAW